MKVVFRADASLQMGSGHLMRCVTLADALKQKGAECHFLCREHPGHLIEVVRGKGHAVHALPCVPNSPIDSDGPAHAAWLGTTQEQDAQACLPILQALQPDWLIVDHYALDIRWERHLRPFCQRLMVIDDLADRAHQCDLLLDQNLGRQATDYAGLVSKECAVLVGPQYALLRPEFAALREYSLERRRQPKLRSLLITMGGVDQPNATGKVLAALKRSALPDDIRLDVVMGAKAPWLEEVKGISRDMPWPTEVLVNVTDMAQRMADCDLAIGAAGSTSWERCCMGVPALMAVLAENQAAIGCALQRAGAAILIGAPDEPGFEERCLVALSELLQIDGRLCAMSQATASITNGAGCAEITERLLNYGYNDSV
ncbi:UDP-2,4-diacetamido-2,4,6-trideoxy-beta-L-altropyranose hydrolase [Pseudomonas sp. CAU 1711]|uniref:UDP-2,4-diacetamido-2,4, 6-trideoxy-beta-L-altropyranose hydrolase n=1 Tax=Pseudomonas sp. CAU 1711 TaxID=3140356 RepID=UPI00326031AF